MESLPNELVFLILNYLLLSTIRKFVRICKYVNVITKELIVIHEKKYFVGEFEKFNKYSIEKFTFELFHDNFYGNIIEQYMTVKNPMLVIYPAYFNNILFLEKLNENNIFNKLLKKYICKSAVKNGQLTVLEWAFHNNYDYDISLSLVAIKYNQLKLLKWLYKNGFEIHKNICILATLHNNLKILKWAVKNGFKYDSRLCDASAWCGYLEILEYAHLIGCDWGFKTCSNAAKNGHLNCLRYAHENGCKWNSETCSKASKYGYLNCLQYAHENDCDWNFKTCASAAKNGYLNCLQYAHENGCEFFPSPNSAALALEKVSHIIDNIVKFNNQLDLLITKENFQLDREEITDENIYGKIMCYSYISEHNGKTLDCLFNMIVKDAMT